MLPACGCGKTSSRCRGCSLLPLLGDGVDNAAHGAAEFGREAVGQHLEFLHGILRNLAADARAAGILVIETVGGVVAVGKERIAHGDAAEADQAELSIVGHRGRQQHEAVHAAAVDRQIVDLRLRYRRRHAAFGVFHQRSFRGHIHFGGDEPTCRVTLKSTVWPTRTSKSSLCHLAKPGFSTSIL